MPFQRGPGPAFIRPRLQRERSYITFTPTFSFSSIFAPFHAYLSFLSVFGVGRSLLSLLVSLIPPFCLDPLPSCLNPLELAMSSRQRDHKLSKQQAQKTAAKAAQTLLRQRCNQPLALPASMPPLQTLPAEFFYEVAALLPYQSIISLSQVSQAFRQKLSFENGNYTFYQALPAVLLMQEEKNDESASNDNDTAMTDPSS